MCDKKDVYITSLRTTLEIGVPIAQIKNAGHGQGSTVTSNSDEFAGGYFEFGCDKYCAAGGDM